MAFIDRLLETLEKKGITQYKLCKDLEIGNSTITSWKKGKMPSIDKVIAIVRYLEISADWLLETEHENLTVEEQNLLAAYRSADPGMRAAARKLLDAPELPGKSSTSENGREVG